MSQIRNQKLINAIGFTIKKLREAKGITQEAFYNDTGIHIGRVETGKVNLSISTLNSICTYLGVSEAELYRKLYHN